MAIARGVTLTSWDIPCVAGGPTFYTIAPVANGVEQPIIERGAFTWP